MIDDTAVHSLQFADDLVIMFTKESGLHRCLGKLELYFKKWMQEVNIDKIISHDISRKKTRA